MLWFAIQNRIPQQVCISKPICGGTKIKQQFGALEHHYNLVLDFRVESVMTKSIYQNLKIG